MSADPKFQTFNRQSEPSTEALAAAAEFRDLFGKDNYYVELMDHGLGIENRVRSSLLDIARRLSLPLVAKRGPPGDVLGSRARPV